MFTGKYGICHVIFILEISLLNLLSTIRVIHVFMVEDIWIIGYKELTTVEESGTVCKQE